MKATALRQIALVLAASFFSIGPASAHGVSYYLLGTGATRIAFEYSDGTPMAGAAFRVFGPTGSFPRASGLTDIAGQLEFQTPSNGRWHVDVLDTNGHAARAWISVVHGLPAAAGQTIPDWFAATSLFMNILMVLALFLSRRYVSGNNHKFGHRIGSI